MPGEQLPIRSLLRCLVGLKSAARWGHRSGTPAQLLQAHKVEGAARIIYIMMGQYNALLMNGNNVQFRSYSVTHMELLLTRPILTLAVALLAAVAAPAFAGQFACNGITSKNIQCADEMKSIVTDRFTTKYPASKFKLVVVSAVGHYPNGTFSGSASVWLSGPGQIAPDPDSFSMHHFSTSEPGKNALELEKKAIRGATRDVMKALGMEEPAQTQQRILTTRRCRNDQVTEPETVVRNVCDSGTYGPTNCRDEASTVYRTVNKQVCD